jgi:hypothetical protein
MQQVRAFAAANALALVAAAAIVVGGVIGGLLLGTLLAGRSGPQAGAANASLAADPTIRPRVTPTPYPTPTWLPTRSPRPTPTPIPTLMPNGSRPPPGPITIPGGDADTVAAIRASADRLLATDRFRFASGVSGRDLDDLSSDPLFDVGMRGSFVRGPDPAFDVILTTSMVEPGGVAAVSSSSHIVVIGDTGWAPRASEKPVGEPVAPETVARFLLFMPDAIIQRAIVPFAAGYALVGEEAKSGVAAIHYRATTDGLTAYRRAVGVDGSCEADLWLAKADGLPLAAKIVCEQRDSNSQSRGFYTEFEVTDAGARDIQVDPPG